MENRESGNGNGNGNANETEAGDGTGTRLIKIEDVLMVLLTIITSSKNWTLYSFPSLKGKWNIHVISIFELHIFT